jgi:beta-glucanase (GH16 family)
MRRRWRLACGMSVIGATFCSVLGVQAVSVPGSAAPAAGFASHPVLSAGTDVTAAIGPSGTPSFVATFRGTKLNTKVWDRCYPWASQTGCTNFGNPEYEWYTPGQVRVYDGLLHLVAQRERTVGLSSTGARKIYYCRSGMITSFPGLRFKYGFIQIRARDPHGAGLWPALWLAAASLKYPPEIDILETWANWRAGVFFHPYPLSAHNYSLDRHLIPVSWTRGWQTYSLKWTYYRLTYYVGSTKVWTITQNVPHQAMYFIANVAENKPAYKGYCTGQMKIKWVKYWKTP